MVAVPFGYMVFRVSMGRTELSSLFGLAVVGFWFALSIYDWATSHRLLDELYGDDSSSEPSGRDLADVMARGPSLPLDLARRGWKPYRFSDSNVVVFLPEQIAAAFDPEGVLLGSSDAKEVEFSATLHRGFEDDRAAALDFVAHLARTRNLQIHDHGTYRYFYDPTDEDLAATSMRFWVIGIPGAMVVVSILCNGEVPVSEALQEIRREVPHIIGELL